MGSVSKSIALIVTSHRGIRVGPNIGSLVQKVLQPAADTANIALKLVDVKSFNLPVFSESFPPKALAAQGLKHELESARAWAAEIASHDAYIFLVSEYNSGMSGAAKNAIDYLWEGFVEKPVAIISYGTAGGSSANENASKVLGGMGLVVVEPRVELPFSGGIGPDATLAVLEGKIGDATSEAWTSGKAGEILKAFGQLESELRK